MFPPDWVTYTSTPVTGSDGRYGAHFWLNESKKMENIPEDLFICRGFKGQRIYIIPSKDLVIVRLGTSEKNIDYNRFVNGIVNCL